MATGETARFDDWRRDRGTSGLADVLGIDGRPVGGKLSQARQNQFRSGRAAYLPELTPRIPIPRRAGFNGRYWAPASNSQQFIDAIRWAAGGKFAWEIAGPPSVATESYHQPDRNRYILHLVNYNFRRSNVEGMTVTVHAPDASAVSKVTAYSPDRETPTQLEISRSGDGVMFTVPPFEVYSIIAVQK